jgi:phosphonate transport system permease protein
MRNPTDRRRGPTIPPHGDPDVDVGGTAASFEQTWRVINRAKRVKTATLAGVFLLAMAGSAWVSEVSIGHFVEGLPGLVAYVRGTLPTIRAGHLGPDIAEWYWRADRWLRALLDTLLMAFISTLLGGLGAFTLCFPAARNLLARRWASGTCHRVLELCRTVPELVFALMFVYAFGLGPLPGVLAISVHSMGALGKLFFEVNENILPEPGEGVRAAGGNWMQVVRYGVIPQVLPAFASYTLLRFEINVRASSVVGFVGAGGIGQELYTAIRQFIYVDVSALVLLLIITVALIDIACEQLRRHLLGGQACA